MLSSRRRAEHSLMMVCTRVKARRTLQSVQRTWASCESNPPVSAWRRLTFEGNVKRLTVCHRSHDLIPVAIRPDKLSGVSRRSTPVSVLTLKPFPSGVGRGIQTALAALPGRRCHRLQLHMRWRRSSSTILCITTVSSPRLRSRNTPGLALLAGFVLSQRLFFRRWQQCCRLPERAVVSADGDGGLFS